MACQLKHGLLGIIESATATYFAVGLWSSESGRQLSFFCLSRIYIRDLLDTYLPVAVMVYDWEGKEEVVMDLYIRQGKSLEDVMEWFRTNQKFSPSKRAFQTQIRKWNFPTKHVQFPTDEALVERVHQLWEQNLSQKQMLQTLQSGGFPDLTERELTRVRDREGLKLRVASEKQPTTTTQALAPAKRKQSDGQIISNDSGLTSHNDSNPTTSPEAHDNRPAIPSSTDLDDEVAVKRQAWQEKLKAESQERLEKRTRRRRTQPYAGLPPDPPAPPRFPSETTLEEAKNILHLDKSMYSRLRNTFEEICQQHGVLKKTEAGHDKWSAVKNQLIDESPAIQHLFQIPDREQLDHHFLAFEMICNDVTKKLRTMKCKVTIADAKNVLGLNPEQGRQVKAAFHQILRDDHFTSKLEAGPEHWNALKQKWIDETPLLQAILAPGPTDPNHELKVKSMEHLCRDVMKRLRDSQTRAEKKRKGSTLDHQTPNPEVNGTTIRSSVEVPLRNSKPSLPASEPEVVANANSPANRSLDGMSSLASQALASTQLPMSPLQPSRTQQPFHSRPSDDYNGQIDPSLLSSAEQYPTLYDAQQPSPSPLPVYFRLAPNSQIKTPPTLWIETLPARTMPALREVALTGRAYSNVRISRIEGVIKAGAGETKLTITDDDELEAYLQHLKGETATFMVNISYNA
ncbi:MAG: hypothetical protein Q9174_005851 [Haloplaca sp. 1 TL-2023]